MNQENIDMAIKKAKKSSSRYKVSAVGFDHKGKVITSAFCHPRFDFYGGGKHAEMRLLEKCRVTPTTILLCRVGNAGDILPIEPCARCQKVLDKLKIKVTTVAPLEKNDTQKRKT